MHITLPVPHPLARLTRVIAALERARRQGDRCVSGKTGVSDQVAEYRDPRLSDYCSDMEFLSLSRPGEQPGPPADGLEFLSLSKIEATDRGGVASLGDLSLERSFPPRPGP
jgi:hypothetical protein